MGAGGGGQESAGVGLSVSSRRLAAADASCSGDSMAKGYAGGESCRGVVSEEWTVELECCLASFINAGLKLTHLMAIGN